MRIRNDVSIIVIPSREENKKKSHKDVIVKFKDCNKTSPSHAILFSIMIELDSPRHGLHLLSFL